MKAFALLLAFTALQAANPQFALGRAPGSSPWAAQAQTPSPTTSPLASPAAPPSSPTSLSSSASPLAPSTPPPSASSTSPLPSLSASPQPAPAVLVVVGQLLGEGNGFLLFSTGDAVRLAPGIGLPKAAHLGTYLRARFDVQSRMVTALEIARAQASGDTDAAHLPREYAVASPNSQRTEPPAGAAAAAAAAAATVTLDLTVPESTPLGDDVYLATDRSNFSPAEVRMLRVDARRFSVSLRLAVGTQVRYEYTRGSFTSIERDRLGGVVDPRTLVVKGDAIVHDSVATWADVN